VNQTYAAVEYLLSLPPASAAVFPRSALCRERTVFAGSDPPGTPLGSAGGTAHLLTEAWKSTADRLSFEAWIARSRKLLLHGSGESRRLPAYAVEGKPMMPLPPLHGVSGDRPDRVLLDLQYETYERLFWHAPASYRVMLTCGDVLLRWPRAVPAYPEADVLIAGLAASPEEARHHGVMVCAADAPERVAFFLQKPPPDRIRELQASHVCFLDTGVWLLNERALAVLMKKCGWRPGQQAFRAGRAAPFELFNRFGPALGTAPAVPDPDIDGLTCAVLRLPDGRFYHFGTNRSILSSIGQLRRPAEERRSFGHASADADTLPVLQHAQVECALGPDNRQVWIENAHVPAGWTIRHSHVLTGVPPNDWRLTLEPGVCLDFVSVAGGGTCLRVYGFDDGFRGAVGDADTLWLGAGAPGWFAARGLTPAEAGIARQTDIQEAPLFPVAETGEIDPGFLEWLVAEKPAADERRRTQWLEGRRLSARQLQQDADVSEIARRRRAARRTSVSSLSPAAWLETCFRTDLAATACLYAGEELTPPAAADEDASAGSLVLVHDRMFRAALAERRDEPDAARHEAEAFDRLRGRIVADAERQPAQPVRSILDDQIVWGRSPVRLDLAGGWTDTPPYCLEHGGRVVNVAVDLNGQPPIQVFGRLGREPEIVIRSIDLGIEDRVRTYEDLALYGGLGSGFGIARAALALAGLHPRFSPDRRHRSLRDQLAAEFDAGIELTLLAAVPKGSGLGTSSILAATILGTLSELFGLAWEPNDLFRRTLALEQMLTSGGGWQDQVGGIAPGLKRIETAPGLVQEPVIRWLPGRFFSEPFVNRQVLLYYTGLTRTAHDILGEIVRGLFLNSAVHLSLIGEIGANADFAADAVQRNDWDGVCEAVRRSWRLNQLLDAGTNPPEVAAVLEGIGDWLDAVKLLGAGGGGYMVLFAKDADAGWRIRQHLTASPPNERARFVDLGISRTGFQVTRS